MKLPVILVALSLAGGAAAGELEIHFLDVGQGNAAFVRGPDGTRVLIDGGLAGKGLAVVKPYLTSLGVTDLDVSVMTHWDQDHYGGLAELFNAGYKPNQAAWDVGNAYMDSGSSATAYLASVSGVRVIPTKGTVLQLGDGATLTVVAVAGQTLGGDVDISASAQIDNSSSIGLVIRYGDFDCYVAGDLTAGGNGTSDVEGPATSWIGQVEVALASHHGSNTSSSAQVVANLAPSLVVQSCGLGNPYGHPTKTTTNRWNSPAACRAQWSTTEGDTGNGAGGFTAVNGHVRIESSGSGFTARRASGGPVLRFATFEQPGPAPAGSALRVSEVLVDPLGSADANGEWFELVNVSGASVDLGGVQVASGTDAFTIASRLVLGTGERVVIGADGKPSLNGNVFTGVGAPWEQFSLANTSDALTVKAPGGAVLDSAAWGGVGFPVTPGISRERADLFGAPSAANFAACTSAWAGADKGTPWQQNTADATAWPAFLSVDAPHVGGDAVFGLCSLDQPQHFYFLGISGGSVPGFDIFGVHVPLQPDAILLAFASSPEAFGALDAGGRAEVVVPVPDDAALTGLAIYSNYLTLPSAPFELVPSGQSNLGAFTIAP